MSRPNINMYSLILLCRQKFSGSKSRFEACFLLPPIFLLLSYYTMHHRYTLYTKKCGTGKFEPEKALWYQTNQPTTPICVLPCSSSEIAEQLQQYCCTPFSCTTHLNATSLLMSCCVCVCVCVCVCSLGPSLHISCTVAFVWAHWVLRLFYTSCTEWKHVRLRCPVPAEMLWQWPLLGPSKTRTSHVHVPL